MCVIVISPTSKNRPTMETLKACEASNRDGGGVAWLENGRPTYRKGIDAEFVHDIMQTQKGSVVAHFRIATVGGVKPVLCHPFPISPRPSQALQGQHDAVLFHNGTWGNWEATLSAVARQAGIEPVGEFSDSRASALVASVAGLKSLFRMGGKFCVLKKDGAWMYNEGWTKHTDGNYYSNMWWESRLQKKSKYYASYTRSSLFSETSEMLEEEGRLSRQAEHHFNRKGGLLSHRDAVKNLEGAK